VTERDPDIAFRDELQRAIGGAYVLERELGGGAMSRVFVARDTALERRIVVKVLPREMAAAVNVERFRREIQLAASLLHPHIIPLLSAATPAGCRTTRCRSSTVMPFLGREPAFDALRSTPRFQRLLEKIGPPEALARSGSGTAARSSKR
jgi:serine/threonine protein kinase